LGPKRNKELLISTCGEKIDFLVDVAYVNGIPLRCTHHLSKASAQRRCFGRMYNCFMRILNKTGACLLISNSAFNKYVIEAFTDKRAFIIYPPIDVTKFYQMCEGERKDVVLSVSRFSSEQNLESIPMIGHLVENAEFLIVGPSSPSSEHSLKRLTNIVSELSMGNRVKVLVNQTPMMLQKLMRTSKILLRTLPQEPFGMAVVEAMAAGCVPVVPRDGGPWFDILEEKQGEYGYSYQSAEEAADIIDMLMRDEGLRREVSARAVKRAMVFDSSVFERKIVDLVGKVYRRKFG
jgi:glycosyltransferase involved in cell wall biosynthesis